MITYHFDINSYILSIYNDGKLLKKKKYYFTNVSNYQRDIEGAVEQILDELGYIWLNNGEIISKNTPSTLSKEQIKDIDFLERMNTLKSYLEVEYGKNMIIYFKAIDKMTFEVVIKEFPEKIATYKVYKRYPSKITSKVSLVTTNNGKDTCYVFILKVDRNYERKGVKNNARE